MEIKQNDNCNESNYNPAVTDNNILFDWFPVRTDMQKKAWDGI